MLAEVGPGYQMYSMDFKKGSKGLVVVGVVFGWLKLTIASVRLLRMSFL